MRVCYITHYVELYGANRSLIDMIEGLLMHAGFKPEDIAVTVPTIGPLTDLLEHLGVRIIVSPTEIEWYNPNSLKESVLKKRNAWRKKQLNLKAISEIEKLRPDIIHSNSSVTLLGAMAAEKLNVPHVWHIRENIKSHYKKEYDSKHRMNQFLLRADAVLCTSQYIEQIINPSSKYNTEVLYNFVRAGRAKPPAQNHPLLTLGIVGLIHASKNQYFTLKALLPLIEKQDVRIHIYGGAQADDKKELIDLFSDSAIASERITLKGLVQDIDTIYNSIDVLINFSEHEAFGRVNIEANTRGIPVIGLRSGATSELIIDGETGLLLNKDASELRNAVQTLIAEPNRISKMGSAARLFSQSFTDHLAFSNRLVRIYKRTLD